MTQQLAKRIGVLPWNNERHEEHFKVLAEKLSLELRSQAGDFKWIVISPEDVENDGSRSQIHPLERTVTALITYYSRSELEYEHVIWFGADNVAVTTHYLHQLATLRKISMKKNNVVRSLNDVISELFEEIASKSSSARGMKVLVVFSNAQFYEEVESRMEIQPFLPKELQECVDFMVLTLHPNNFSNLSSAVFLTVSCDSGATHGSSAHVALSRFSQVKLSDPAKEGDLDQLMKLLLLLYPNNITTEFVNAAIEHIYKDDNVKARNMADLVKKLTSASVLKQIKSTNPAAFCIEREYQDYVRTVTSEDDISKMALQLQGFFEYILRLNEKDAPCDLFSKFGTEAAMHQSWLATVAAVHVLPAASTSLLDKVVQYVNVQCVGRVFIQHRQDLLGRGNYSVFKGYIKEPTGAKRDVAVKCMPNQGPIGGRHGDHDHRPLDSAREIQSLMTLNFDHIVRYIMAESDGLCTYVVMELCDQTLGEWVKLGGFVDLEEDVEDLGQRFKFLHDATKGLEYLNSKKILHRDIKPSNILLKRDGARIVAKIADFGLSKPLRDNGFASVSATVGTQDWVAPEMSRGAEATHMADMYSFGKVCYFVLSCGEKLQDNFGAIDFAFDFYGVSKTVEALVSKNPTERISAKDLLEYPMFWIAEGRTKFANFVMQFFLHFGNDNCDLRDQLQQVPLNWRSKLTVKYAQQNVVQLLFHLDRKSMRGENAFDFLRVSRNAIEHAREHKERRLKFVDQYFGHGPPPLNNLDHWKYFQVWFKPFPTLFFTIWQTVRNSSGAAELSVVADLSNQRANGVARWIAASAAGSFEQPELPHRGAAKSSVSIEAMEVEQAEDTLPEAHSAEPEATTSPELDLYIETESEDSAISVDHSPEPVESEYQATESAVPPLPAELDPEAAASSISSGVGDVASPPPPAGSISTSVRTGLSMAVIAMVVYKTLKN